MITSDEAKNIIELSFNEYITVLLKVGLSVKLIESWKEDLIAYVKQQEKLQAEHEALKKDVARYFELKQGIPPLEDEMNYQFTQKYRLEDEPKDECYFRISNEYYRLEEKLSKVGKKE